MRQNAKILIAFFLIGFLQVLNVALAQGWLSGWAYRKPITIDNTQNSNTLTDYQVLITLDTTSLISAGKMRSDCGDIRFTDSDGETLLNYWIESGCNSANTKIWVKVSNIPASSTKTIYVYYGNSGATSLSNYTAVISAPNVWWTYTSNPSSNYDIVYSVAVDIDGYIVTGRDNSPGNPQWRVQKLSRNGSVLWTYTSNPSVSDDIPYSIAVDDDGYVIGGYDYSPGNHQWRVEKINKTGSLIWTYTTNPSTGSDFIYSVAVDDDGYIVAGFDGYGGQQWRVEKISKSGSRLWSYTLNPSSYNDIASSVAVDNDGYIIAGYEASPGQHQWRVEKLSKTGSLLWSYTSDPSSSGDLAFSVAVDNDGYIVAGSDSSPGKYRIRVEKISKTGNLTWVYTNDFNTTGDDLAYSITVDSEGYTIAGRVDIAGVYKLRVEKLSKDGRLLWSYTSNVAHRQQANSIAYDSHDGLCYVVGGEDYQPGNPQLLVLRLCVRKYTNPEPTTNLGSEETGAEITIYSPLNQTYFVAKNFEFVFRAESSIQTTFELKAYLDDVEIYSNSNYQNGTLITLYQNLTDKTYNFTVWANASNLISTSSIIFTIKAYEIINVSYNLFVYETSNQTYEIVFRVNYDLVENITSVLVWNETNQQQQEQIINSTHLTNKVYFDIPLVETNNTQASFYFSNQILFKNETQTEFNTDSYQQNIIFAYIPTVPTYPQNVIEYDFFNVSFNPICHENRASLTAISYFANQTNTMQQTDYCKFLAIIDAVEPNDYNQTHTLNISFVISFKDVNITRTTDNYNITVYKTTLTDCTIFPTQTFSLIVKDEETQNTLTGLNYTFLKFEVSPLNNRITRTYTFENKQNICIYPSWAEYNAKIFAIVRKDSYAITGHAPYTISRLSNQTSTLTLYMLPLSYATPITFTLPQEGYILYVERMYGSNFVYVRSEVSDFNKKAIVYLRPYDIFYKIKVFTNDQKLCFESKEFKVASTTYEITRCSVEEVITIEPIEKKEVSMNCTTNELENATEVYCTFISLDNLDHNITLTVYKIVRPFGEVIYYQNSTYATTGAFYVELPKGYDYKVVMTARSIFDYLQFFVRTAERIVSSEMFYYALILFVISAVIGMFNPFAGLITNVLILLTLSTFGLITLETGIIGSLALLFILAIIFTREWR